MTNLVRGYGLVISSEIELPGALELPTDCGSESDLEIVLGDASTKEFDAQDGPYKRQGDLVLFEVAGVARYRCEGGRKIVVEPAATAGADDISALLIATALPALLWMRERQIVVHAAGALLDDKSDAIAVCGPSGSGKSTILRSLLVSGARAVGDDTLRADVGSRDVVVSGLPGNYYLAKAAGERRMAHAIPKSQTAASAPLAAMFVLNPSRCDGPSRFERLTAAAALEVILRNRHRPRVPRLLKQEPALLEGYCRLAGIAVYSWKRPQGALDLTTEERAFLAADHSGGARL